MNSLMLSRRKTVLALFGSYNPNSRRNLNRLISQGELAVIDGGGGREYIPIGAVAHFAGVSVEDVQRRIEEGERRKNK